MASTNPTILLVHGAYHCSDCYDKVAQRLEALSYPVLRVNLRTTNGSSPSLSYKDDVEEIHSVILPLMDEGQEVVIVGHSYGGVPAYVSTEGQSIAERTAAGKKGGVRSIVFLCAFAHPERNKYVGEVNTPSDVSWVSFREDGFLVCNEWAKTVLYEDLPEEEREFWFQKLATQTPPSFMTPVHMAASDLKVPSMYLVAEKDRAVMLELQEKMIAAVPGMKSIRVPCGHSPFLSHPDETVDVIVKGAELR